MIDDDGCEHPFFGSHRNHPFCAASSSATTSMSRESASLIFSSITHSGADFINSVLCSRTFFSSFGH
uniref:Uncharacterized protein n=1 Tax=Myoviridae sp. ctsIb3 TaxID=2825189 RepID=A0A8S5URH9_9CAUD|nr:MAG TPA: hypothetical protein [Myoviridae sp. ctsIb3]DAI65201.1 MAG TPA: hypothetical protein [Caudoviricetes sp.]